jgi:hypothetical protein
LDVHRAVQLDASLVLLRHVDWSHGQFVMGPKLGWTFVLRHNPEERTFPYITGVKLGTKVGIFLAVTPSMTVGSVLDLDYLRAAGDWTSTCFYGEPDCRDMWNTFVGSVALAMLF